jgi:hypothetical protein
LPRIFVNRALAVGDDVMAVAAASPKEMMSALCDGSAWRVSGGDCVLQGTTISVDAESASGCDPMTGG